jgi:photosystem II stability/assembly factor-like uncharacterized protein
VTDLSFVGTEHGWALGHRACAAGTCQTLYSTADGGRSWKPLAPPPKPVDHIRFASDSIGYAFSAANDGATFAMTTNGGSSWTKQPGSADALEILNGTVIRVVDGGGCPPGCAYRVELSAPGSTSWHAVALPGRPGSGDGVALVRTGHDAYLANYGHTAGGGSSARTMLEISHDDGASWTRRGDPCPTGTGAKEVDLAQLTTAPDGSVVAICAGRVAGAGYFVIVSTDHGRTFHAASRTALGAAAVSALGAATARDVLVMSDQLYRSTDGGNHFAKVVGPSQASFMGFETTSVGRVLSGANTVWTTRNGGASWTSHRVR